MITLTDSDLKYYKTSKRLLKQVSNMFWQQTDSFRLGENFANRMSVISDKLHECVELLKPLEEEVSTTRYVQLSIFDAIDNEK